MTDVGAPTPDNAAYADRVSSHDASADQGTTYLIDLAQDSSLSVGSVIVSPSAEGRPPSWRVYLHRVMPISGSDSIDITTVVGTKSVGKLISWLEDGAVWRNNDPRYTRALDLTTSILATVESALSPTPPPLTS